MNHKISKGKKMPDVYTEMSCPNCESQYAVEFMEENINGKPDYCPFCGEEIPEESDFDDEDDEEQTEDESW
jgi:NAD-dependent SIR2 family protein deacetylase